LNVGFAVQTLKEHPFKDTNIAAIYRSRLTAFLEHMELEASSFHMQKYNYSTTVFNVTIIGESNTS